MCRTDDRASRTKRYEEKLLRWLAIDLKNEFFAQVEYFEAHREVYSTSTKKHNEIGAGPSGTCFWVTDQSTRVWNPGERTACWTQVVIDGDVVQKLQGLNAGDVPSAYWPYMSLGNYHRIGISFTRYLDRGFSFEEWNSGAVTWATLTPKALAARENSYNFYCTRFIWGVPSWLSSYEVEYPPFIHLPELQLYDYNAIHEWRPGSCTWTETVWAAPLQRFYSRALANTTPYMDEYSKRMSTTTWHHGTYPYQAVTSYEAGLDKPKTLITLMYPTLQGCSTGVKNDNQCYARLTDVGEKTEVAEFLKIPGEARITSLGIV
jgi:hypothetical protein